MSFARHGLALALACMAGAAGAQETASAPAAATQNGLLDKSASVNIDAQALATAMLALSRQFGFQLAMAGDSLAGKNTEGLHGDMSLREALDALLQSTGSSWQQSADNTITIAGPGAALAAEQEVASIPLPEPVAAPAQAPAEGDDSQRLDDVVVTATKRPQRLRDIPQSITEMSGDDLERRGAQNLQDIVKLVPGVNLSYDVIAPRVTIRGISQSTNTSPTTGAIFGNVSFADAYLPAATLDVNPFDLESVEVLKGPQGTLYGSSNLNGAVRYVPKAPVLGSWETRYYGQYTNIEGAWAPSYGAVVNTPLLRDDLALRVTAFRRNAPGYVDTPRMKLTDTNSLSQEGIRGMLAWQPENWEIGLTYAYQSTHTANVGLTDVDDGQLQHTKAIRLSPQQQAYNLADLSVAYDFGWARLVSETSTISKRAQNFLEGTALLVPSSPVPLASQPSAQANHTYCQEFRLSSPDDRDARWHWMMGALAWKQIIRLNVAINIDALSSLPFDLPLDLIPADLLIPDGAVLVNAKTHASAREYAAFGEITRRIGEKLEITVGGRYYQTLSGGTNDLSGIAVLTQGGIDPTNPGHKVLKGDIPESGFNPKVSASYRATDNVMAFVNTSRGYRVGGVQYGVALLPQPQSPVPEVFKSDTVWSLESGLRTEWRDKTLRLDATGFVVTWNNPQYYTLDAAGNSYYLTNVGGVKTVGAEGAFQWLSPWAVMVNFTAAYANTVTTKVFKAPNGNDAPPGSPWPYSPKWQTATTVALPIPIGSWNLLTGVTYTTLGKTIADLSSELPVYGFQQLDFNIGVSNESIPWLPEINVSMNNALNERGIGNHSYNNTSGIEQYTYITPRTLNIRLTGHF